MKYTLWLVVAFTLAACKGDKDKSATETKAAQIEASKDRRAQSREELRKRRMERRQKMMEKFKQKDENAPWRQLIPFFPDGLGKFAAVGETRGHTRNLRNRSFSAASRMYQAGSKRLALSISDRASKQRMEKMKERFEKAQKRRGKETTGKMQALKIGGFPALLMWNDKRKVARLTITIDEKASIRLRMNEAANADEIVGLAKELELSKLATLELPSGEQTAPDSKQPAPGAKQPAPGAKQPAPGANPRHPGPRPPANPRHLGLGGLLAHHSSPRYNQGMQRGLWLILLALLSCKSATDAGGTDRQAADHYPRDRKATCIPTPDDSPSTGNRSGEMDMHPRVFRERAIGPTEKLSRRLQRVFDPAGYLPLARPGPHDWLANHPEPGQTYEQFLAAGPNTPDKRRRHIDLLVVGSFTPKNSPSPPTLAEYATAYLGIQSRLLKPARLAELSATSRVNPHTHKRQIYTPDILDALRKRIAKDAFCLQAVTMEDLYPDPSWNFVFGQASLTDRVGVYSFARYTPDFSGEARDGDYRKRLLRRSLKVMVHEIGHMFGLLHCVYFRCLMNGSNHLAEADARPMHLCPACLRKLHHSVGFDPVARYQRLETFYRRHGFAAEADFVASRVKRARN